MSHKRTSAPKSRKKVVRKRKPVEISDTESDNDDYETFGLSSKSGSATSATPTTAATATASAKGAGPVSKKKQTKKKQTKKKRQKFKDFQRWYERYRAAKQQIQATDIMKLCVSPSAPKRRNVIGQGETFFQKGQVVMMTPKTFLALAQPISWWKDNSGDHSEHRICDLLDAFARGMVAERGAILLQSNARSGSGGGGSGGRSKQFHVQATSHQGRHRAYIYHLCGIRSVPVTVGFDWDFHNVKTFEAMGEQDRATDTAAHRIPPSHVQFSRRGKQWEIHKVAYSPEFEAMFEAQVAAMKKNIRKKTLHEAAK